MFFHRPGHFKKKIYLRASNKFRGKEKRNDVFVNHNGVGADLDKAWVAQLILFIDCHFGGERKKLAYVRWYETFGRPAKNVAGGCRMVKPQNMAHPSRAGATVG